MKRFAKTGLALTGSLLLLAATSVRAAECVASNDWTNPDASLTNATSCGDGVLNTNDSASVLNANKIAGFDNWGLVAKVDSAGQAGLDDPLATTGVPGLSSGEWAFNTVTAYNQYLIVIKDGSVDDPNDTEPPANKISWFWFLVDMTAACSSTTAFSTYDECGTWTMFGENGNIKAISHLALYGSDEGGAPPITVPEPLTVVLIGSGLLGIGLSRRRWS